MEREGTETAGVIESAGAVSDGAGCGLFAKSDQPTGAPSAGGECVDVSIERVYQTGQPDPAFNQEDNRFNMYRWEDFTVTVVPWRASATPMALRPPPLGG